MFSWAASQAARRLACATLLAVAVVVVDGVDNCYSERSDNPFCCYDASERAEIRLDKPTVYINEGGWESMSAAATLIRTLLIEKMGVRVEFGHRATDEDFWTGYPNNWGDWLLDGSNDLNTGSFPGFFTDANMGPLLKDGSLKNMLTGPYEKCGIWMPDYTAKAFDGAGIFDMFKKNEALRAKVIEDMGEYTKNVTVFDTNTLAMGTEYTDGTPITDKLIVMGSMPSFVMTKYAAEMLESNGMNSTFVVKSSESALNAILRDAYAKGKHFIANHYTPTNIFGDANVKMQPVYFPYNPSGLNSDPCYVKRECDWIQYMTGVMYNPNLETRFPEVVTFLRSISWSRSAIAQILDYRLTSGDPWEESACQWLKANEDDWKPFIQKLSRTRIIHNTMDPSYMAVGIGLFVFISLLVGSANIFTILHSGKTIMKMFQWRIMLISSLGVQCLSLSIVFYGVDESHPDFDMDLVCALRAYLPALGFAMFFQAIVAKLYRVHRIFADSMRKTVIKDTDLFMFMTPGIITMVLLIVLWSILDPPVREIVVGPLLKTSDPLMMEQTYTGRCTSGEVGNAFGSACLIINCIAVIVGANWAWETRNVWIPAINDSKQISYVTLITCVIGGFELLLLYMIDDEGPVFIMIAIGITLVSTVAIALPYLPKILAVARGTENEWTETNSRASMSHKSRNSMKNSLASNA